MTSPIQFARLPEGVVVIRVSGRGTHQFSPALTQIFDQTKGADPPPRYVLDLDSCVTMDSTFLGTLASLAIHQRQRDGSSMVAVNVNEHVKGLLQTLGLGYVMEIRPAIAGEAKAGDGASFTPVPPPVLSRLDQIVLMLEAHERLVGLDGRNEVKFEGVLSGLRDSLDREKSRS